MEIRRMLLSCAGGGQGVHGPRPTWARHGQGRGHRTRREWNRLRFRLMPAASEIPWGLRLLEGPGATPTEKGSGQKENSLAPFIGIRNRWSQSRLMPEDMVSPQSATGADQAQQTEWRNGREV
jgi:hypothetical protein